MKLPILIRATLFGANANAYADQKYKPGPRLDYNYNVVIVSL